MGLGIIHWGCGGEAPDRVSKQNLVRLGQVVMSIWKNVIINSFKKLGLLCGIDTSAKCNCQKKTPKTSWVFFAELKKGLKITEKPPKTSWVFFEKLKNVLKIAKKPPKTSWVFFEIEKCAKDC